jgi:hypothetical protein
MKSKTRSLVITLGLGWLVLMVFGRSLSYQFAYDDQWTIVQNPALRSVRPIGRFFTDAQTVAAPAVTMASSMYRPLPTLSFAVDFRLWGLNPWPWRLENLLLHAANGILLFFLLTALAGFSTGAGLLSSLIFLFHPAQVESVVWITQRSNLMCLLGMLVGLGALAGFLNLRSKRTLFGFLAAAFALFSKETAAVFPALFLLWNLPFNPHPKSGEGARSAGEGITLLVMVLGYLALRTRVLGQIAQRSYRGGGFADNLLIGCLSWWEYCKLIVWPVHLTVSHNQYVTDPRQSPWPWVGLIFLALTLIAAFALWQNRQRRPSLFLAWIVISLSPVLGLVPTETFMAERFLYIPLVGVSALAGWAWDHLRWNHGGSRLGRAGLCGIAVALGLLTIRRTSAWRDNLTLWQEAVRTEPDNSFAHACLAETYAFRGQLDAADVEYKAALVNEPSGDLAFAVLTNLASIESQRHHPVAALRFREKASKIYKLPG